jgi:hypothetical protein
VSDRLRNSLGRWLLSAAVLLPFVLGAGVPASAESPEEAQFLRLHAEVVRAAEAVLANAGSKQPVTPSAAPPTEEGEPASSLPPDWQGRVTPETLDWLQQRLEAEGVPAEFVSVGWVESRFSPGALSPKGARGVWQLMPATARHYGLEVSPSRDDRTDLARSTRVAARYLADLNRQFNDWLLALAAYNAGPQRVEAAIARAGSRNFWQLRPWLPAETREYVPAVLAAMRTPPVSLSSLRPATATQEVRPARAPATPVESWPHGLTSD